MDAVFYFLIALLAAWLGFVFAGGVRRKRPLIGTLGALVIYGVALAALALGVDALL